MIKKEKKNYILIRKQGNFYHVYDEDAYIFNYLFNYKIINNKVGFPVNAKDKIINILDNKNINYILEDYIKDFKNKNNYNKIYLSSLKKNDINKIINEIELKLMNLNYDKLMEVLLYLNNVISN